MEQELVDLIVEMVRAPSYPGIPNQEQAVVEVLASYLRARGLDPLTQDVVPGRPNLLCTVSGPAPGPHLVLCGHTDTVPPSDRDDAVGLRAEVKGGRIYGRGTADMKGGLAAMAAALVKLRTDLRYGSVTFAAVADEEMQSLGAEALVRSGIRADGAIIGEPTGNSLHLGHKGLEWIEVQFFGRAAHGGHPEAGVSAIAAAGYFMEAVARHLVPQFAGRAHPLLGPPTINFGTIKGGEQPSTVPGFCSLCLDRRLVPGESYATVIAELEQLLADTAARFPGLKTDIARMPSGMATMEHVPCVTEADHSLPRAIVAAGREVGGLGDERGVFPAWSDAALLAAFAGIPSVVLGPGDLALAHSPHESIAIAEVMHAVELYAGTARHFCGGERRA